MPLSKIHSEKIYNITTNLSGELIREIAQALADNQFIIGPTDTLYGIVARADRPVAVEKIFAAKNRRPEFALPLIATDITQVQRFAYMSAKETALAERFWPGPLTLVLQHRESSPVCDACMENGTLAIRVPDNTFCRSLAEACGTLLTATSSNLSGEPPAETVDMIHPHLAEAVNYIIDVGQSEHKTPSTIVKFNGTKLACLRQGPISLDEIRQTLGHD